MIDDLSWLFEGVKVNFCTRLDPFEVEMRTELVFLRHDVVFLGIGKIFLDQLAIVPFPNHDFLYVLFLTFLHVNIVERGISKYRVLITQPFICPFIQPLMLWTVTLEFSFQPWINRSVMPLDVVIKLWLKLVRIKHLDGALLPPCADGLPFPQVNLNVHHPVREWFQFCVIVCSAVKYQVSWL